MTDRDLIKRDLLNALLIRAGTLPGRPEVGTRVWDYLFDPNDSLTTNKIENEIRRIIALDLRIDLHDIVITSAVNTISVHVSVSLLPAQSAEEFFITFLQDTQTATIA